VVVTSIVRATVWPRPSAIENVQCPAPLAVTANAVPLDGETVAIPLHEFV